MKRREANTHWLLWIPICLFCNGKKDTAPLGTQPSFNIAVPPSREHFWLYGKLSETI